MAKTKKELLRELRTLKGVEIPEGATNKVLAKLIKDNQPEPEPKKTEEPKPEKEAIPEYNPHLKKEEGLKPEPEPEPKAEKLAKKDVFALGVFDQGGKRFIRGYNLDDHGKKFRELAAGFVEKVKKNKEDYRLHDYPGLERSSQELSQEEYYELEKDRVAKATAKNNRRIKRAASAHQSSITDSFEIKIQGERRGM